MISVINQILNLSTIIKDAIQEHSSATTHISTKLIETVNGSKEIYQAITEVANLK